MAPTLDKQTTAIATLQAIKLQLEQRKEEIYHEIKEYPPPIPACDAQFNYLLELRNGVTQELNQVNTLLTECQQASDPIHLVESFVQSSMVLKKPGKSKIQQSLLEFHGS